MSARCFHPRLGSSFSASVSSGLFELRQMQNLSWTARRNQQHCRVQEPSHVHRLSLLLSGQNVREMRRRSCARRQCARKALSQTLLHLCRFAFLGVEKQNCRVLIVFWKGCNKELGGSFVEEDGRPFHEDCVRRMASGAVSSDVDPNNAWQIMKDSEGLFLCFCSLVVDLAGLRAQMSHLSASHSSWRRSVREGPLQEQVKKKIVFVLFFLLTCQKALVLLDESFFTSTIVFDANRVVRRSRASL